MRMFLIDANKKYCPFSSETYALSNNQHCINRAKCVSNRCMAWEIVNDLEGQCALVPDKLAKEIAQKEINDRLEEYRKRAFAAFRT